MLPQTPNIAVLLRLHAICVVCDERRVFNRSIEAEHWRFVHEVENSRHVVSVFEVDLANAILPETA